VAIGIVLVGFLLGGGAVDKALSKQGCVTAEKVKIVFTALGSSLLYRCHSANQK